MLVAAVVVTYNRKALLERCLEALGQQNQAPDQIFVVDNSSTDDTRSWLASWLQIHLPNACIIALSENLGGAGGFKAGMQAALDAGADWIWMMDDDAEPHPDALKELMNIAKNPSNVYGSLATSGAETAWMIDLVDPEPRRVGMVDDVPKSARVEILPFLGFMIHRQLIENIGLPDEGFFIAADDMEYCVRAKAAGADIMVAGKSHIEHPKSRPYVINLLWRKFNNLQLPAWKRYYDTRNRLLIARRHYGLKLYTQALPVTAIRMIATLTREPEKKAQLKAYFAGIIDGLLGRKGRRHQKWGIKP